MRAVETREIDGLTFTVQQLPALKAIKLLAKLGRQIAPALGKLTGGAALPELAKGLSGNLSGLGDALQLFADRFTENDLEALQKELFETAVVEVEGTAAPLPKAFDLAFKGRPGTFFKALGFALEVNYGDFFGALLAASKPVAGPQSKA